MEATIFSGWIYDHLSPYAAALKVAHPLMLRRRASTECGTQQVRYPISDPGFGAIYAF